MSIWISLLFLFIWWILVKIYFDRQFQIMEERYQEIVEILTKDIKANIKTQRIKYFSGEEIEECFKAVPYFEKEEDK